MKFAFAALSLLLLSSVCFASWTTPLQVGSIPDDSVGYPALAIDSDDNIHMIYSGLNYLNYTMSSDRGLNWSLPVLIFDATLGGLDSNYKISVDLNDNLYVFFSVFNGVYLKKSTDGGISWSGLVNISNSSSEQVGYPSFYIDSSDVIHVAMRIYNGSASPNDYKVYYTNSSDGGASFNPSIFLGSSGTLTDYYTSICTYGNNVYLAFLTYEGTPITNVSFVKSANSGVDWSSLTPSGISYDNLGPISLECDSTGKIHLAYMGDVSTVDLMNYTSSINEGSSWSTPVDLRTDVSYTYDYPSIFFDSNDHLYFTYTLSNSSGDYYEVYNSSDGLTWTLNVIPQPEGYLYSYSDYYSLAIDSNDVPHICIESYTDINDGTLFSSMLFKEPSLSGFSVIDSSGGAFDFDDTSLTLNNSAVNITWSSLSSVEVYSLSGVSLGSILSSSSDATITISPSALNRSANITISGLSGVTEAGLTISHDGTVVYQNGARIGGDLLSDPTFVGGTLTMEVSSFSEWTVEEASIGYVTVMPAPGLSLVGAAILFLLAASVFLIKKG